MFVLSGLSVCAQLVRRQDRLELPGVHRTTRRAVVLFHLFLNDLLDAVELDVSLTAVQRLQTADVRPVPHALYVVLCRVRVALVQRGRCHLVVVPALVYVTTKH